MKKFIIPILLLATMACSSIKIAYDYDKDVDFSKYKTYNLEEELIPQVGELDRNRMIKALESELVKNGLTKSDNPDIIVALDVKTKLNQTATANTTGGYGYGRYRYGGGFSTTQIDYDQYTEGTVIVSLVDNSTEHIVWQGTGTKTLSENANADKKESNINYAMEQIFKNYPPTK